MQMEMRSDADDKFTVAFDYASGAIAERVQNPLWRLTEIFMGARMREAVAIVKAFGKKIVDNAVEDREKHSKGTAAAAGGETLVDEMSGSLIQSLLDSIGDKQVVADAALNYLSAGKQERTPWIKLTFPRDIFMLSVDLYVISLTLYPTGRDTTAQALTWAFHLLMQHRYVYAKVRREVYDLLQSHHQEQPTPAARALPFDPTLFTPASLPYTHAVFNEALRLYPPIPIEIKQALSSTTLPDGTRLPAGCIVVWCVWALNRARATWGPDADQFRPERWLSSPTNRGAAEFPVFNGGPRLCLGKTMAERVAVQVIASVAWAFDFVPAYEGTDRRSKSSLTLPMEGGLPVFVKVRNRGVDVVGDGVGDLL